MELPKRLDDNSNLDEYLIAWETVGDRIARFFGARMIACDPDFVFVYDDSDKTFSMRDREAVTLSNFLKGLEAV